MNSRLNHIQDWSALAQQARWSASALAKECGVSVRTLERHFRRRMGKSPKAWLAEQRQSLAIQLLQRGSSVKETAGHTGYQNASAFSREFKKHWGNCPAMQSAGARPVSR